MNLLPARLIPLAVLASGLAGALAPIPAGAAVHAPASAYVGAYAGAWNPRHWYLQGAVVSYAGAIYVNREPFRTGANPAAASGVWEPVGVEAGPRPAQDAPDNRLMPGRDGGISARP